MSQAEPLPFLDAYEARLRDGRLREDAAQRRAAEALQQLYGKLTDQCDDKRGLLARMFTREQPVYGLYLWGGVGRGKSMLMDLFVEAMQRHCPTRRVHFHAFMLDVHRRLHAFRQLDSGGDLLPKVAAALAAEQRVLCLDELQVTDVTDAMILARLFTALLDGGVTVLFTSNRPPNELYQGGLQREQFLQFIALVKQRLAIIELKSATDYRLEQMRAMQRTYVTPCDAVADDFLLASWEQLTGGASSEPLRLEVQGRVLRVDKHAHGVAWLTFAELCNRPLSANDYLTLAKMCHTVMLQCVPRLTREERNEAKRFVTLIDTLYDQRVKLIVTAEATPDALYPSGDGSFEFQRTVSRLMEMQSEQYLALAHIA